MPEMSVVKIFGLNKCVRRCGGTCSGVLLFLLWFSVACVISAVHADAALLKEAILFRRDGNVWIMDSDGNHQRQITTRMVGHFSASRDGKIVFDRFSPVDGLADRNLYYMASVRDGAITRLTHDNESITPLISPDGTTVAYQKYQWAGKPSWEGSGKGIWVTDVASSRHEMLVGVAPVPPHTKRQRNALLARSPGESLDETKWLYDHELLWAPDSQYLVFFRTYAHGGDVAFLVSVRDRQHRALPDAFGPRVLDLRSTESLYFDNGAFSLLRYDARAGTSSVLADKVFVKRAKFSPDGKEIAALVQDHRSDLPGLWIMKMNGSDRRAISVSAGAGDLIWSLDGRRIVFTRYVADHDELWIVNTDGSQLKKLADNASSPIWIHLEPRHQLTGQAAPRSPARTSPPPTPEERQAQDKGGAVPPRIYVDEGACPFECCVYRQWIVEQATTLFAEKDRTSKIIATLQPFQVVKARTGVVWTRPAKLEVVWDHEPFRRGEIVYLLTYEGEGVFKVWQRGEIVRSVVSFPVDPPCNGPSPVCWGKLGGRPESTWWVQIETPSGQVGWTDQPDHFGNKDACG